MNSDKSRVLVVAAHPDDEVLGAGGTIKKLSEAGSQVTLLILTDGHGSREHGKNRYQALDKSCEILGIQNVYTSNFPDNQMDSVPLLDVVKFIESKVDFNPDLIFTHHPNCLNIDHSIAFKATTTAFRPQYGHPQNLYSFYIPSSTEWNPLANFNPNTFIDISEQQEDKRNALNCYEDELKSYPHARSIKAIDNLCRHWGNQVGLEFAEAFVLQRSIQKSI